MLYSTHLVLALFFSYVPVDGRDVSLKAHTISLVNLKKNCKRNVEKVLVEASPNEIGLCTKNASGFFNFTECLLNFNLGSLVKNNTSIYGFPYRD